MTTEALALLRAWHRWWYSVGAKGKKNPPPPVRKTFAFLKAAENQEHSQCQSPANPSRSRRSAKSSPT